MTLKVPNPHLLYNMHVHCYTIMTIHKILQEMYYLLNILILLLYLHNAQGAEEAEHRDFQYNSVVDPQTGRYNFAYDTGHDNEIAHSLHMQYRDINGIVRGRYGYTDPRGKLRMVEYEAGPEGFVARGDVGPDQSPHDQAPETQVPQVGRYTQNEDLNLIPRPVQMAGWDPGMDPMGQPISGSTTIPFDQTSAARAGVDSANTELGGFLTTNVTSSAELEVYAPDGLSYDERYPRLYTNENDNSGRELENMNLPSAGDGDKQDTNERQYQQYPVTGPVNVNTIDVNPNDIRASSDNSDSSAEEVNSRSSRALPYSYRNYRPSHDHDSETRTQPIGYRVVYRPNHDHYNERYYRGSTHDHDAEKRSYVRNRQTHDHDAERKYYYNRNRWTHDHDAEKPYYYRNGYYRNGYYYRNRYYSPNRRRIFYRDSHSMEPHEHYNDIYRNENDLYHQHSDRHLYGRSQNLAVPATARPRQLKYIPSDKYHDKYYYWSD